MIIDTSALVAIAREEAGFEDLAIAIRQGPAHVPAPALVEYSRVVTKRGQVDAAKENATLDFLLKSGLTVEPFTADDATTATDANMRYGLGNGRGGTLNFGDLMVYAVAKRLNVPVLCTGRDFTATDIAIHPASRVS